jgi:FkbM family methyltransferase
MEAGGNDQCFWDIGANIGLFSVSYAKRYPGSKVMAFEPMPLNYLILQENIALNHLRNIAAHQIAIGNDNSKVTLRGKKEPGWGGSSLLREEIEGEDIFVVDVFSVDHLCLTRKYPAPTFVKIDVEGFEMEVFKGMEQIIKAHHPRLFVELHEDYLNKIGISLENALDLLCTEGYRLEFMEKHKSGNQFQCIFVPKAKS